LEFEEFKHKLQAASTEEAVKAIYATHFDIEYDTADKHDLYTPEVLFEFKNDKNFGNLKAIATVLAQIIYYVRRLKYEGSSKVVPPFLCLADKDEAVISSTVTWHTYYTNDSYDWERAPSKPDPLLVDHLVKEPDVSKLHIFKILKKSEYNIFRKKLSEALSPQMGFGFIEKKSINEENFEAVYEHWNDIIGKHINNGYKLSSYFLANLQRDRIILDKESSRVVFTFEDNVSKAQKILMNDYEYFWDLYEQVRDVEAIKGIHAKIDRLTEDSTRRFEGEFYTPLHFAKKAVHYLERVLGKNWYKSGKYRIWDMAAGTGNLEWHLPAEAYKYLYMSTLHASETDHNKKVFPDATCFQYDYLKDDVEYLFLDQELPFEPQWKLPKELREDLKDESLTWVVYINPPFATAQVGGAKGENKKGVSDTKIDKMMVKDGIGHAKRELFAQFMYRISKELPSKTYLGMFSKLKYLNAPDSIDYRDQHFNYKYEKGFLFKSTNFHGVKGKYPIGFLIWNLSQSRPDNENKVIIDVCNDQGVTIGEKHLSLIEKNDVINKWFQRPKNSDEYTLPPLSNGITVKEGNVDKRHRSRPDFLASICSKGNDFQNSKYVTILSSPSVSAGAFSVIEETFEQSLILHAVRKIPVPTWLNDRNQFLKPKESLSQEFIIDCVIWSLFSLSNETTALKDVLYNGKTYQIKNNFFPYKLSVVKSWEIRDPDFKLQASHDEDRFVATWISSKVLSPEALEVINSARKVYKYYFENLHLIGTRKYKIDSWDAGWYQIRRSLADQGFASELLDDVKKSNSKLADKILPLIEENGFLDLDDVYEKV
jgi:hypothetical protein